ncbi:MAG TPA: diacylglycerol kinase family protein [Polyangia bacterium]
MNPVALFVNPRSRANRRNPRVASQFQALLGEQGRVFAPKTLDELASDAASLRAKPPSVIAVHGGDGTLHRTVAALGLAFGEAPIPPLAILGGGTMNVVSASLGIRQKAAPFLSAILGAVKAERPLETVRRRCLRIGDTLGFIFGNGLMTNFLGEYYGTGEYGPARATWLLLRAVGSAIIDGPFIHKIFKRFEGTVEVDGQPLERTVFIGVGAATVREVGLGFKLNHRADEDVERFGVLAIHGRPAGLIPDFWAVYRGRGVSPKRSFSAVASTMTIVPKGDSMAYTIDGDLYHGEGPLVISVGPPIEFVRPPRLLALAGATAPRSLPPGPGVAGAAPAGR